MVESVRKRLRGIVLMMFASTASGCATGPHLLGGADRRQQYLAAHTGIPADLASAIDVGHVSPGMNRDQVRAVLGQPLRITAFSRSHAEIWLFPVSRFHQDQMHSHGAVSFRLVFIGDRLTTIEPI